MNTNKGIFGLIALIVIVVGIVLIFQEADDGPLENAAEDIDDAIEDAADKLD